MCDALRVVMGRRLDIHKILHAWLCYDTILQFSVKRIEIDLDKHFKNLVPVVMFVVRLLCHAHRLACYPPSSCLLARPCCHMIFPAIEEKNKLISSEMLEKKMDRMTRPKRGEELFSDEDD
jgi:hypothetical protein